MSLCRDKYGRISAGTLARYAQPLTVRLRTRWTARRWHGRCSSETQVGDNRGEATAFQGPKGLTGVSAGVEGRRWLR